MSEQTKKIKRGVRRNVSAKAGSSPEPEGAVQSSNSCGHGGCGHACRVRYVGQTSHLRDHYTMHAARGVTHIWSAAVVTGLAVVLTGAVGYSVVEARDINTAAASRRLAPITREDLVRINGRMEALERALVRTTEACSRLQDDSQINDANDEDNQIPPRDEPVKKFLRGTPSGTSSDEGHTP